MATQRIVDRLNAASSWLQAWTESDSDDYAAAWHAECRALGVLADKELAVWKALCSGGTRQPAIARARLCALLSVFTAGAHVHLAAGGPRSMTCFMTKCLNASHKLALLGAVTAWIEAFLDWEATASAPSEMQLGLAQALLRAQLLEGFSRQLSTDVPTLAADEQATDCSVLARCWEQLATASPLVPRLSQTACLLTSLANLSERCAPVQLAQKVQALAAASALGLGGTVAEGAGVGREADSGGEGDNPAGRQGGSNPNEEWASSALEGAPQQVVDLLDAVGASGVVEHAARAVLLLAEWVRDLDKYEEMLCRLEADPERTERTPEQVDLQEVLQLMRYFRNNMGALHACAVSVNGAYYKLSTMAYYPGALFGDRYVARTAARVPPGATAVGYLDAAAVGGMAPLEARCYVLDAPRVALLRRVLTGPCARHLVLSMGLRTLSALDGGSTYGLPQGAGFEVLVGLHNDGSKDKQQQQQQQVRLLTPQPLRSLLMLLAVRPCGTAGAVLEAGPAEAEAEATDAQVAAGEAALEARLRGQPGTDGEPGAAAAVGPAGEAGTAGDAGTGGEAGTAAAVGPVGEAGTAGDAGTGGEAWAEAAVGPVGEAGTAGDAGTGGEAGAEAAVGPVGEAGTAGVAGTAWEAGAAAGSGLAGPPRADRPARRGLPCRAVRLEVTLRVARAAAAGAGGWAGVCGAPGPSAVPCYSLEPGDVTAMVAVQALQFAWRHLPPPPRNGGNGGRRRAALREWAAAVADVASSGVVAHASKNSGVPWRLGLLLGLAPHVVGPMSGGDLPALASGGNLLRAVEALVRHVAEDGEGNEEKGGKEKEAEKVAAGLRGCPQGYQGAPATAGSTVRLPGSAKRAAVARIALQALATEPSGDAETAATSFCDLLLLRGDDEALGTQRGGEGGAGRGAPGPRAAASVAVAVGKLLWRCQGRMVEAMQGFTDHFASFSDQDGALAALEGAKIFLRRGACGVPYRRLGRGRERAGGSVQQVPGSEGAQGEQRGAVGAGGGAEDRDVGQDERDRAGPSGSVRACVDTGSHEQQQQQELEEQAEAGGEGSSAGGSGSSGAGSSGGGVTFGVEGQQEQERQLQQRRQQEEQLQACWQGLGEQEQLEVRRRVRVWAYAAWRWLPGLAGLARRGLAEGLETTGLDTFSVTVWQPLLWWVKQLCLYRFLHAKEAAWLTAEHGNDLGFLGGVKGSDGGSSGGRSAGAGGRGAAAQGAAAGHGLECLGAGAAGGAAAGGCERSSSCGGGGGGEGGGGRGCHGWCGCWREFLLCDVGAVEVLATAFWEVVPGLLCDEEAEEEGAAERATLMWAVVDACVMLAAAYPEEVARAAWGPAAGAGRSGAAGGGGGAGGSSGSGGGKSGAGDCRDGREGGEGDDEVSVWTANCAWPPDVFEVLEAFAEMYDNQGSMQRALTALGEWGGECVRQGRAVGPSKQQRAALEEGAEHVWSEKDVPGPQLDVLLLPPLCELRALLPGVCSNPRCMVLPPPGQTEAEAAGAVQQAAAAEREAGVSGRLEAWYCCRECREEHGRVCCGEGGGRGAGAVQQ